MVMQLGERRGERKRTKTDKKANEKHDSKDPPSFSVATHNDDSSLSPLCRVREDVRQASPISFHTLTHTVTV
jgi:hypothetical protein